MAMMCVEILFVKLIVQITWQATFFTFAVLSWQFGRDLGQWLWLWLHFSGRVEATRWDPAFVQDSDFGQLNFIAQKPFDWL
jgi:hypothetical protein